MIDEIEMLRRYIDATVDSEPDLAPLRRRLVTAIQDEGEAAPASPHPSRDPRRSLGRRTTLSLGSLAVAGVVAAVAFLSVAPSASHNTPKKTAPSRTTEPFPSHLPVGAQLRLIADRVTEQPVSHLQADQLLHTRANLSVFATVNNGAAQATIGVSVQKWSTASGQTCTMLTAQPAQFASPSEQAAWVGLHLLVTPNPPTASQCLQGNGGGAPPDAITGAGQLIDVSSLPTDPSTLAQEFESGTTGVAVLDQLTRDEAAPNPAFQRAAMLLIGPTVGATPRLNAALYQALALLPGVIALGPTTTHDGQSGQGYASGPGSGQSSIVVDTSTGQLLEVRGLDDSNSLSSIAPNYLGGGPMVVHEYSAQLQWLDTVGSPSVVSRADLPAGLPVYVFATTKPGLPCNKTLTCADQLVKPYSSFLSSERGLTDQSNPGSTDYLEWSLVGPRSVVDQFVRTLRESGLFALVSEI